MILFIDFRSNESLLGFVGHGETPIWERADSRDDAIGLLKKLEKKIPDFRIKLAAVVVAKVEEGRDATWS